MIRPLACLLLATVLFGCVPAGGQPTTSPPFTAPATNLSPATDPPASDATPTPATSLAPTEEPVDEEPMPPDALLVLPDGSSQPGALGSYAYDGAAADSPWLPARVLTRLDIAAASRLGLRVAGPQRFVSWSARYADAQDEEAETISPLASGGDGTTPLDTAEFGALPAGDWVLMVQLFFADDLGDATYYWYLSVP